MKPRLARAIAWALVGIYFLLSGTGLFLQIVTNARPAALAVPLLLFVVTVAVVGIWPIIGALIVSRHPRHPVPWLLFATFPVVAIDMFTIGYVSYAISPAGSALPLPGFFLVWLNWSGMPFAVVAFNFICLLFPGGKLLPGRRWRLCAGLSVGALLVYLALLAIEPGPLVFIPSLDNPYAASPSQWALLAPLFFVAIAIFALCSFTAAASLVLRLRRARGDERQQIKWLLIPATLFWIGIPPLLLMEYDPSAIAGNVGAILHLVSVPLMVIAVAVSIFKYRLYDFDLIVNRTLVYGALSAAVALLYVAAVGVSGLALQTNTNVAALLLTTLIVVALRRPLHSYAQRGADRLVGSLSSSLPVAETGLAAGHTLQAPSSARPRQPALTPASPGRDRSPADGAALPSGGYWLQLARGGWLLLAAAALLLLVLAVPGYLSRRPMGNLSQHLLYEPTPFMQTVNALNTAGSFLAVLLTFGLAALIFKQRKDDRMALFVAAYLLVHGLLFGGVVELLEPIWPEAVAVNSFILLPLINVPLTFTLLAVFPDGRFVPPWTRWALAASYLLALPATLTVYTQQRVLPGGPLSVSAHVGWATIFVILVGAQVFRYRRVSDHTQRQQTRWVLFGFLLMIFLITASSVPWNHALSLPPGTGMPWWVPPTETVWFTAIAILPLTLTVAVLRYRLYDLDVLVNRTLVFGALTAGVILVYVLVVGGLSAVVSGNGDLLISLAATGLIAVLFQPMRERLQRAVNRLMYGERDQPFDALARLGRRLEGVLSPQMVIPTIVETVAHALKLPYAAITVKRGERFELVETYGKAQGETLAYPLMHQGATVGQLLVARRAPDEPFSAADERLLRGFARQAGAAVHAVQLMSDLQRSRQQLVTAREEERRRLRRDLHDGLGPALASVVWQADSARDMVQSDPHGAVQLLDGSIAQAQAALSDIRRLVHGLRPPALDELGLVGALQQAARQYQQTHVVVHAPKSLPALPAAVEVAAYRIVQEALKNAVEHGAAKHCAVHLSADGHLQITVEDDGVGLPPAVTPGVGLVSMRERAEELGGAFKIGPRQGRGTVVDVRLPLATE